MHVPLFPYSGKDTIKNTGKADPNVTVVHWHYSSAQSICTTQSTNSAQCAQGMLNSSLSINLSVETSSTL